MIDLFRAVFLLVVTSETLSFHNHLVYKSVNTKLRSESDDKSLLLIPSRHIDNIKLNVNRSIKALISSLGACLVIPSNNERNQINKRFNNVANAIGNLHEFQDKPRILQGVTFNVPNTQAEYDALNALCLNTLKILHEQVDSTKNIKTIVTAFGPNDYSSPVSFHPGISTFYEDGGHATLTFQSSLNPISYEGKSQSLRTNKRYGNYSPSEVKYIKIGTEVLRISKGIEKGVFSACLCWLC